MSLRDANPTQGFKATEQQLDWRAEEDYWRENWQSRPYASADRDFAFYSPAYRYGYECATRFLGRSYSDVEDDLRAGWDRYDHRGQATWEHIQGAVRDGWNRVTTR